MLADRYTLRAATAADDAAVQQVEVQAAQRFALVDLAFIAECPPLPQQRLAEFRAVQGLHVLTCADAVVAVVAHEMLEGAGYLAELDVHPEHAGQRLGLRLLDFVEAWTQQRGGRAVWLTTFRDVPWNGPYYRRAGYEERLPPAGSVLAQRLGTERRGPLGVRMRVAMCKTLRNFTG